MRADGLTVGQPFFVIQFFDREGYFSSCLAHTEAEVKEKASKRALKTYIAFTVPFPGTWEGNIPNISMPPDFKEALACIDNRPNAEE